MSQKKTQIPLAWQKRWRSLEAKERAKRKRWLSRPHWPDPSYETWRTEGDQKKVARQCESTSIRLGWSKKRLASFQKLFAEYQRSSSIATYLKIRRSFPEVEISAILFLPLSYTFEDELERLRIGHLVGRALDADEHNVDDLCLRLMELLVERDALPKSGPGYIYQRQTAISDALLNYVISMVLESYLSLDKPRDIPGSLVVLMRRQLCGENPDLYGAEKAFMKQNHAAELIADGLDNGEQLTLRKAAKLLNMPRSTTARWFASKVFQKLLEEELKFRGITDAGAEAGRITGRIHNP